MEALRAVSGGDCMVSDLGILERLPYWAALSEAERREAARGAVLRSYERGALIHGGGAECLGMALVLSGLARAYVLSGEGREVTLFRIAEGGGCVLSASCVISEINFDTFLGAERDTRLLIVPSGVFGRLAESNLRVKLWMYEQAASRFSDVMWSMQNLLFNRFDRRLADFLLEEYARGGSREIRMTHEQLAQNTSSAREVVARMLKRFASDGLVDVSKRGAVRLTDIEGLKNI